MSFKFSAEEVIEFVVRHSGFSGLFSDRREDFINGGACHGMLDQIGGDGGDILSRIGGLFSEFGPRFLRKAERDRGIYRLGVRGHVAPHDPLRLVHYSRLNESSGR